MSENSIIVGIDVGTTKVCTLIGKAHADEYGRNKIEVIGFGNTPSHGLKKGTVVNIDATVGSITNSVYEAQQMSGVEVKSATIGIAGSHIYSFNTKAFIPIKGKEITQADVEQVLETTKAAQISNDKEILHVIPQEYKVDNISGIHNPVGMVGKRLEACVHIVTGSVALIQNLVRCVEQAGVKVENIILQPIASSESVLSPEEKELGVALVDIGGGTTDIAVWHDGSLVHSAVIPVGGNHFTDDLSIALKISHAEAERIKVNHGGVLLEKVNPQAQISVDGLGENSRKEVPVCDVVKVLGYRAEELFDLVKAVIQRAGLESKIPGGVVITGGGAKISGMADLGEYIMGCPVKIGYPIPFGSMTNIMQEPMYSTALGLLLDASTHSDQSENQPMAREKESDGEEGDIKKSIKSIFSSLFY